MTEECRIKYIQYLQCKYADLVQSLTDKLKLGRQCKELETRMLIVRDYLKSLYCYKGIPDNFQVFTIDVEGVSSQYGFSNVNVSLTINSNPVITVYNNTSNISQYPINDILNAFENLINLPEGFETLVDYTTNTVYIFSSIATISSTISSNSTYVEQITNNIGIINYNVQSVDPIQSFILNKWNCLTTCEICTIVKHGFRLVEDCNC